MARLRFGIKSGNTAGFSIFAEKSDFNMHYFSYVVYSPSAGQFFYGYCEDTEKVTEMHNANQIDMTRGKGPWVLMFSESFDNKARALRQSRFYRTVKGQRLLKKILNF